jgi:hypothetical protein
MPVKRRHDIMLKVDFRARKWAGNSASGLHKKTSFRRAAVKLAVELHKEEIRINFVSD